MLEHVNRDDPKAFKLKQGVVQNFINSQVKKLDGVHKLLTAVVNEKSVEEIKAIEADTGFYYNTEIPYKDNPLVELYSYMQDEMQNMQQFRTDMAGLYEAWNGNEDVAIMK